MKLVRTSIFETNSSSTHSLTLCMKDTYDKWKAGELFYSVELDKFYSAEERKIAIKHNILDNMIHYDSKRLEDENGNYKGYEYSYTYKNITYDNREQHHTQENLDGITDEMVEQAIANSDIDWDEVPMSYKEWHDWLEHEDYYQEFTTPSNEIVVGFGYYGYDG